MSGTSSASTFTIKVPSGAGRGVLELHWSASAVLDFTQSAVTLRVDGQPVMSRRLEDAASAMKLVLPVLEPGFHIVEVDANLAVAGDPCLERFADEAWLRVDPSSTVNWDIEDFDPQPTVLSDLPEAWRTDSKEPTEVEIDASAAPGNNAVPCRLEADHVLRGWGFDPRYANEPGPTVVLGTLEGVADRPGWKVLESLLRNAPEGVGALHLDHQRLFVLGRDAPGLCQALEQLRDGRLRKLCGPGACVVGPRTRPQTTEVQPRPQLEVWRLSDQTDGRGWTARGEGSHSLRFRWDVPAAWSVSSWPTLELPVTAGGVDRVDPKASHLHIELNGRPLATYALSAFGSEVAPVRIRIPKSAWSAPIWEFHVEVRAAHDDAEACDDVDPSAPWLHIDSTSALEVPRDEARYEGLATFFSDARGGRPLLHGPLPSDTAKLAHLAAALFPFAEQTPRGSWRVHDTDTCSGLRCIRVYDEVPHASGMKPTEVAHHPYWRTSDSTQSFPFVPRERSIHAQLERGEQSQTVHLAVGAVDADPSVPDWGRLSGRQALMHEQRWYGYDQATAPASKVTVEPRPEPTAPEAAEAPRSEQHKRHIWINVGWALGSIVLLAALGLVLRRRPRTQEPA